MSCLLDLIRDLFLCFNCQKWQFAKFLIFRLFILFSIIELNPTVFFYSSVKTDLTKPSILIPKGSLPAGIYIVKLTATIERANLLASDAIFIKMVDLPLRSVINGGSFRKATWAGTLTLDAQKTLSLNQPDEQLEFSWKCLVNDIEVMKYYGVMWEIEAR